MPERFQDSRFQDSNKSVYAFTDMTFVECPSCGACAVSARIDEADDLWFAARRLTCTNCGYNAKWKSRSILRQWRSGKDDYFGLPLWLQTECRGEILWAYNERHLEFIESIARATHRERKPDEKYGWSNQSLLSRLPAWLKSRKNRDHVLNAIARLKSERLPLTGLKPRIDNE